MRPDLRAYLLGDEGSRAFGPGPRELLHRIEETGSLRSAAASMGMAYTKATRLVKTAEASFGFKLTERTIGGAGGGGSRLTTEARDLLGRYEAFEHACVDDLRRNFNECFSGFCDVPRVGCVVMASGLAREPDPVAERGAARARRSRERPGRKRAFGPQAGARRARPRRRGPKRARDS